MLSLKSRLLAVEDDYIHALAGGEHAVIAFGERWELLMADIDASLEANDLDEETTSLAHATAIRISTLADTSIDIYSLYNAHTSELVAEVNSLMSQLSLDDLTSPPSIESLLPPTISTSSKVDRKSSPRKRVRDDVSQGEVSGLDFSKRCRTSVESSSPRSLAISSDIGQPVQQLPVISAQSGAPCAPSVAIGRVSRKRRMSEGDKSPSLIPPPKRLYVGPRLHAVSDSFPGVCGGRSEVQRSPTPTSSVNWHAASRTASTSPSLSDIQPANISDTSEFKVGFVSAPLDLDEPLNHGLACSGIPSYTTSYTSPTLNSILYPPREDPTTSVSEILCGGLSDPFPPSPDSTLSTHSGRSTPMTPSLSEDWNLPPLLFEVDCQHHLDHLSPCPSQPTGAKYPSGVQSVAIFSPGDVTLSPAQVAGTELNWDALFGSLDPSVWLSLPPPPHWPFDCLASNSGPNLLAALSSPIHGPARSVHHPLKLDVACESCGVLA